MIQGLSNLLRAPQRDFEGITRRTEVSRNKAGPETDSQLIRSEPQVSGAALLHTNEADEYASVINFELVPSGRIYMNREAREHIVDFFQ